ncbi:hypothetical protein BaRGS_00036817 [Batillaria attramentaria]|uniref:Uncharacterized protein n=1 Tax=Batillaria attramentaria TaxID=370345 RepID=A0ABD0JB00_9CAEN
MPRGVPSNLADRADYSEYLEVSAQEVRRISVRKALYRRRAGGAGEAYFIVHVTSGPAVGRCRFHDSQRLQRKPISKRKGDRDPTRLCQWRSESNLGERRFSFQICWRMSFVAVRLGYLLAGNAIEPRGLCGAVEALGGMNRERKRGEEF